MKSFVIFLTTLCGVLSIGVKSTSELNTFDNSSQMEAQQEDRWSWGLAALTDANKTDVPTTNPPPEDPCAPFNPPRPDFSAPGRRISETKCYEYVWEIKYRDDKVQQEEKCYKHLLKGKEKLEPNFAIGGRETEPGEFPHMGAIGWKATTGTWIFKCGSSLISNKFVLTAAHCSRATERDTTITDPVPQIVRLGDKNIIDTYSNGMSPKDAKIIRILTHPKYAAPKQYFDIALMELDHEVSFTKYIQPACLWAKHDTSSLGTEATLTGWGVVESAGRTFSPELQAAVVDLIDSKTCDSLLRQSCNRNWCGVQDHQLCGGKLSGGVDACQGDSGGPLQVKIELPITSQGSMHHVIGVTSFGVGCALPKFPGVYTRVSSFIDWIESNVWTGK